MVENTASSCEGVNCDLLCTALDPQSTERPSAPVGDRDTYAAAGTTAHKLQVVGTFTGALTNSPSRQVPTAHAHTQAALRAHLVEQRQRAPPLAALLARRDGGQQDD